MSDYIYFTITDRTGTIVATCATSEAASDELERRAKVGTTKNGVTPTGEHVPLRYTAKSHR